MLSGKELSFFDTLLIAVSGMTVVMLELVLIAVMIVIMSRLIRRFGEKPAVLPVTVPAAAEEEDEIHAVLRSVLSEELQIPLEQLEFRSIKEISEREIRG